VDLRARLDRYEVTAVPSRQELHLVWSEPEEALSPEPPAATSAIAILADYRITRVPARAAS
jgi:hypothetical protein